MSSMEILVFLIYSFSRKTVSKKIIFMTVLHNFVKLVTRLCIFLSVTTTELASVALSILREQKEQYKLVIANMNLPDIDNLAFLHLLLKKDIPVIRKLLRF